MYLTCPNIYGIQNVDPDKLAYQKSLFKKTKKKTIETDHTIFFMFSIQPISAFTLNILINMLFHTV